MDLGPWNKNRCMVYCVFVGRMMFIWYAGMVWWEPLGKVVLLTPITSSNYGPLVHGHTHIMTSVLSLYRTAPHQVRSLQWLSSLTLRYVVRSWAQCLDGGLHTCHKELCRLVGAWNKCLFLSTTHLHSFLPCMQLSVMVSYQATVGTAELSLVDKDQGVTTKAIR